MTDDAAKRARFYGRVEEFRKACKGSADDQAIIVSVDEMRGLLDWLDWLEEVEKKARASRAALHTVLEWHEKQRSAVLRSGLSPSVEAVVRKAVEVTVSGIMMGETQGSGKVDISGGATAETRAEGSWCHGRNAREIVRILREWGNWWRCAACGHLAGAYHWIMAGGCPGSGGTCKCAVFERFKRKKDREE
jgi:hypothetical protein